MKNRRIFVLFMLIIVTLYGCNLPGSDGGAAPTPTLSDGDIAKTAAAKTVAVQLTQSGGQSSPQPLDPTLPPGQPTVPMPPTYTPFPTYTLPPTFTPLPTFTPTESIPCDRVTYIKDVTIPDGTDFIPGATFTKTWRLKNTGTCTWNSQYSLVFFSGESMGAPASKPLTSVTVTPGSTVDVSVNMTAPVSPGSYKGNFKLRNASNVVFGLGDSGNPFYVKIDVVAPLSFTIEYENIHDCIGWYAVMVKITNNGSENIESANIELIDLTASATLSGPITNNQPFMDAPSSCATTITDIEPGDYYYIGIGVLSAPTTGHKLKFIALLCTQDGLGGDCLEKFVKFYAP